jgi:hypothetical protein
LSPRSQLVLQLLGAGHSQLLQPLQQELLQTPRSPRYVGGPSPAAAAACGSSLQVLPLPLLLQCQPLLLSLSLLS